MVTHFQLPPYEYHELVGCGLACAPVRSANPSFRVHCTSNGALRAPAHRSFAASYSTPKNIYNLSNLGRPCQGLFSFHWTTEAMKYEVPCPRPTHHSFADPSGNIFGVKLCTDATIRPYFFRFLSFLYSFWIFSFCYSLLFLLSFSREKPAKIPVWQKIRQSIP